MAKRNKKQEPKTLRTYKRLRNTHYALKVAPFVTSAVPFAVEAGVYGNEWFTPKEAGSAATGLILAVLTTLATVLAVAKRDSEFMKKLGPFIPLGIGFLVWGVVCLIIADLLNQFGYLLIAAGSSILVAAVEDTLDKTLVKGKYEYMKKLADDNGYTKKGKWEAEQKAIAESEREEIVYVPHD